MVAFGIMDNTIMITVGDLIDDYLGMYITSALTAAAFGQCVSDLSGTVSDFSLMSVD